MTSKLLDLARLISGYKILETVDSKYNGEVTVVQDFGETRVMAGGLTQSGGPIQLVWAKPLSQIKSRDLSGKRILILGLGSGTLAGMISDKGKESQITGVEIDPEMVRMGKTYLNMGEVKNLNIVIEDAVKFVNKQQRNKQKYDFIFVDLYRGEDVPEKVNSKEFFERLFDLLSENGTMYVNRTFHDDKSQKGAYATASILKELPDSKIQLMRSYSNLILVLRHDASSVAGASADW